MPTALFQFLICLGVSALIPLSVGLVDFAQYWAAAHLFLDGGNPYSPSDLAALQAGLPLDSAVLPILMWNPPIVLPLIAPLGLLDGAMAQVVWRGVLLYCVLSAFLDLREVAGETFPRTFPGLMRGGVAVAIFYPIALALSYGQLSPLLLAFFSRGLRAWSRADYTMVGAWMALTLSKPHLLALWYLWGLLTVSREQRQKVLLGAAASVIALVVLATLQAPLVWNWYFDAYYAPPVYWQTPNLGSWLQALLGRQDVWVRCLPLCVSAIVVVIARSASLSLLQRYFYLAVPVSLLVSPYGWTYDFLLLLPALGMVALVAEGQKAESRTRFLVLWLGLYAVEVGLLALPAHYGQQWDVWFPVAVGVLLVVAATKHSRKDKFA